VGFFLKVVQLFISYAGVVGGEGAKIGIFIVFPYLLSLETGKENQ
jgi:hypothetical protein